MRQLLSTDWRERARIHWLLILGILLVPLFLVLFFPPLTTGFVNDDFIEVGARHYDALDSLPANNWSLWTQRFIERAVIDPVTDWQIFRPTREVIFWANYLMFHLNPLGYRLSDLLLYLATCIVVGLLGWRLTRWRTAAALTMLLFAIYPIHIAPVSAIASVGHILAGFFVALCVLFYVMPPTRRNRIVACAACLAAIGSKETALITPALLLLYEVVYHRRALLREPLALLWRQLPFWLIAVGVVAFRLLVFGHLSNAPVQIGLIPWNEQIEQYMIFALRPFLNQLNDWEGVLVALVYCALIIIYRKRNTVLFGLLWVPLSLAITIPFPPQGRYFFTPSIGMALAFGSIFANPLPSPLSSPSKRWIGWAAVAVLGFLIVNFEVAAAADANQYRNLGATTQNFTRQMKKLHPAFPPNARLVFIGLPAPVGSGQLFIWPAHLQYALQFAYADRTLHATTAASFPTPLTALDRTFFFEYGGGKIKEHPEIIQALRDRQTCNNSEEGAITWQFQTDAQGWEPWSEIDSFQNQNGALTFHTTGNDPFMASPYIQVRPGQIDHVEIRLSAQAKSSPLHGKLYWLTDGAADFSDDASTPFQFSADGKPQTISFALDAQGTAPLVRLRLDPGDAPANIQLNSITLVCR